MGILGKILAGKMVMSAVDRARSQRYPTGDAPAGEGQYLPADPSARTGLAEYGSSLLNSAGQYYKQNPRKVQMLGLLAGAALLASMSKGRRPF
jgi:hypothetical protein